MYIHKAKYTLLSYREQVWKQFPKSKVKSFQTYDAQKFLKFIVFYYLMKQKSNQNFMRNVTVLPIRLGVLCGNKSGPHKSPANGPVAACNGLAKYHLMDQGHACKRQRS